MANVIQVFVSSDGELIGLRTREREGPIAQLQNVYTIPAGLYELSRFNPITALQTFGRDSALALNISTSPVITEPERENALKVLESSGLFASVEVIQGNPPPLDQRQAPCACPPPEVITFDANGKVIATPPLIPIRGG